ncbi:DUF6588 family protein [Mucilaginibacter ginkgonis]|uniref:Uncharacterized protein n=1 Tax=Mucilaginibacter ginkgonis TaxID=2682091 RepID=A0A6I4I3A2_9SPHI|nr:DUF6588 family protein [Mucilaginibacter ginkgonis]QQL48443.1 hypothetical protein GO620_009580 [Mucilaginibacter ginkgonis]
MKKNLYAFLFLMFIAVGARAQDGFDQLIRSTPADATKLINAYSNPLFKGLGFGLNSGWTNTAKTKGFLHFDVRITASYITPPVSDKSFDVTKIGLSNHVQPAGSATIAQTFNGSKNLSGPTMNVFDDNGNKVTSFDMPSGQLSFTAAPQLQATVGLVQNTDVTVRYIPDVKFSDDIGTIGMFGFGLKHNIAQDFNSLKHPVPFDLSVAFGYSRLNYSKGLNVQPESGAQPLNAQQSTDFRNQKIDGHINSFLVQAILSKKFLVFTPFVAVGYNTAKTEVGLLGNYPITSSAVPVTGQKFYTSYNNPVNITNSNVDGVRGDLGFQLDLAFFRFYASYSLSQSYNMANAGIGLSF